MPERLDHLKRPSKEDLGKASEVIETMIKVFEEVNAGIDVEAFRYVLKVLTAHRRD